MDPSNAINTVAQSANDGHPWAIAFMVLMALAAVLWMADKLWWHHERRKAKIMVEEGGPPGVGPMLNLSDQLATIARSNLDQSETLRDVSQNVGYITKTVAEHHRMLTDVRDQCHINAERLQHILTRHN